jgi:hypothetical protein
LIRSAQQKGGAGIEEQKNKSVPFLLNGVHQEDRTRDY